ncbi:Transposase [Aquisphaera giovannonii]|uniref:Transposase n=1 Tax=Aquisphaera giovannonii TaxID=406548 RepID=A0A5B9W7T5_9BACT|nr:IS630 transposase-related protein [Aquisphaera giovannonii]QEH36752.1 Transposase [Aquisphaera giovannonii]
MRSYSMDLRERVVAACDDGEGTREEVAGRFRVSIAWVYRLLARRRDTGSIAPKPHGGGRPAAFRGEFAERHREAVEDCPDATLEELRAAAGVGCGTSAVFRALKRLGLPRKDSPNGPPSRAAPS